MFFFYPGNVRNRQISYLSGTTAAVYTYHPDNLRKTKTVNGSTTNFVWANGNLVHEFTNTSTKTYFYAIILVSDSAGQAYLYNTHGDVVKLIGTLTWSYQYDAYGIQQNPDPLDGNAFRYAGQYFDTESGTYYLRARYYNPATGRFTQQDAWTNANRSDPLGLNLYLYCNGNPVRYWDPWGQYPKEDIVSDQAMVKDSGGSGGAGIAVLGLAALASAYKATTEAPPIPWHKLGNLIDDFTEELSDILGDSVLESAKYKPGVLSGYSELVDADTDVRDPNHPNVHHIVAQGAPDAQAARDVLDSIGMSYHDERNLVVIPYEFHKYMHTTEYYKYVNECLRPAMWIMNDEARRAFVYSTLRTLQLEILFACTTGISPWG